MKLVHVLIAFVAYKIVF